MMIAHTINASGMPIYNMRKKADHIPIMIKKVKVVPERRANASRTYTQQIIIANMPLSETFVLGSEG
jgi:hypothetical protein